MKRIGFISLASARRVTPSIKFACTYLYIWVERGTVNGTYPTHVHNFTKSSGQGSNQARSIRKRVYPHKSRFSRTSFPGPFPCQGKGPGNEVGFSILKIVHSLNRTDSSPISNSVQRQRTRCLVTFICH